MEHRRTSNYLGIGTRLSLAKFSSSSDAKSHFRENHTASKNQFHSKHAKLLLPSHQRPSHSSKHYKDPSKMSSNTKSTSLKRRSDNDDKDQPFKKQIIEVTGLEKDTAIADITPRTISTITTSEIGLYARRRKAAKYADVIRRKKALVRLNYELIPF